jgi:hypothetical protein
MTPNPKNIVTREQLKEVASLVHFFMMRHNPEWELCPPFYHIAKRLGGFGQKPVLWINMGTLDKTEQRTVLDFLNKIGKTHIVREGLSTYFQLEEVNLDAIKPLPFAPEKKRELVAVLQHMRDVLQPLASYLLEEVKLADYPGTVDAYEAHLLLPKDRVFHMGEYAKRVREVPQKLPRLDVALLWMWNTGVREQYIYRLGGSDQLRDIQKDLADLQSALEEKDTPRAYTERIQEKSDLNARFLTQTRVFLSSACGSVLDKGRNAADIQETAHIRSVPKNFYRIMEPHIPDLQLAICNYEYDRYMQSRGRGQGA